MNKKFILLPALAASVLGIASCSTNKNNGANDPSKPHGTEMSFEEIKEFASKGHQDYYFEHLDSKADPLFNIVKSGKINMETKMSTASGSNTMTGDYKATGEFDLDDDYIFTDTTEKESFTVDEETESEDTHKQRYYESEDGVLNKYEIYNDNKRVWPVTHNRTIAQELYGTFDSLCMSTYKMPYGHFEFYEEMFNAKKLKMYKEKETYFVSYTYFDEEMGQTYDTKVRFNDDYLAIYNDTKVTMDYTYNGVRSTGTMTMKHTITPCEVTRKSFDKTGF